MHLSTRKTVWMNQSIKTIKNIWILLQHQRSYFKHCFSNWEMRSKRGLHSHLNEFKISTPVGGYNFWCIFTKSQWSSLCPHQPKSKCLVIWKGREWRMGWLIFIIKLMRFLFDTEIYLWPCLEVVSRKVQPSKEYVLWTQVSLSCEVAD